MMLRTRDGTEIANLGTHLTDSPMFSNDSARLLVRVTDSKDRGIRLTVGSRCGTYVTANNWPSRENGRGRLSGTRVF